MEQMKIPESMIVRINYEEKELPSSVRELRPVVFKDGESYCCLLGPDPQEGIFGCGNTEKEALNDWKSSLEMRIDNLKEDDEVAQYVKDRLNASNKKIW